MTDVTTSDYPLKLYFFNSIKQGFLPLWTPNLFSGFPLFAEGESGVFYPLSILFLILPIHVAFNYFIIIHLFLAGAFTYVFARIIQIDRTPALISAVTFIFSSFFINYYICPNVISAAVWLPLIFCFFELYLRKKRVSYLILGGVFVGFQFLAGYAGFSLFTFLIIFLYCIFRLTFTKEGKASWHKPFVLLVIIFLIGAGLGAIQILPQYDFTTYSNRATGLDIQSATVGSLFPQHLFTFILPNFLGISNDQTYLITGLGEDYPDCVAGYLGIIPLLLASIALFSKKNRLSFFFLGIALLSLLFSFGQHLPFYRILLHLPVFNMFRYPVRFLFLYIFSVAMLAGIGCHYLLNISRKENGLVNFSTKYGSKILLLTIFSLIILGIFYFKVFFNLLIPAFRNTSLPHEIYVEKVKSLHQMRAIDFFIFACSLIIGLYLIISYLRGKSSKAFFRGFLLAAICVNLLFFGVKPPVLMKKQDFLAKPETVRFLEGDKTIFRINSKWSHLLADNFYVPFLDASHKYLLIKELIGADQALAYNLSYVAGVPHALFWDRYWDWLNKIGINERTSNLLNVKYILSAKTIDVPHLLPVFTGKEVTIYQNINCLPRAFMVHRAEVIPDEESILKRLKSPDFDFRNAVIVEEEPESPLIQPSTKDLVKITNYSPHEVIIAAKTDQAGFLVLTDTNYPGWKVYVDGKEDKIFKANYIMRAVYLKPGQHEIKFIYSPRPFKAGATISVATLLGILVILLGSMYWGKRR